jgi:hypothetical protein
MFEKCRGVVYRTLGPKETKLTEYLRKLRYENFRNLLA